MAFGFVLTDTSSSFPSLAFFIYAFITFLINLWATSGRNGTTRVLKGMDGIAARARTSEEAEEAKWYQRVPEREVRGEADAEVVHSPFIIGDER